MLKVQHQIEPTCTKNTDWRCWWQQAWASETRTVDANVFQKTEDNPNEYPAAFPVVLD